jgi:hypothetical protein
MNDSLRARLARSLEVSPDDILTYRETAESRYAVILHTFQKFTKVRPAEEAPPWLNSKAYQSPAAAAKAQLVELCATLGLDVGTGATKKQLVSAVKEFKAREAEQEHTKQEANTAESE